MAVSLDAARLLCHRAAWLRDSGQENVIKEASYAKLFATEAASRTSTSRCRFTAGPGWSGATASRACTGRYAP